MTDAPVLNHGLPPKVTAAEFPVSDPRYAGYRLTFRTASDPITPTTGYLLKWESGPVVVNGAQPPVSSYPTGGSTLEIFTLSTP